LLVSSILAAAWNVPEKPSIIDVKLVVSSFFVWIFVGLLIHIGLRLIGGTGRVQATLAAVIYASASVSLAAVPVVGALSYFTTNTKVTLTYPYLISYGEGDWTLGPFREMFAYRDRHQESFIRESDPGREFTIIPPMSEERAKSRWPRSPADDQSRIPLGESTFAPPTKSLSAVIAPNAELLWTIVAASYFVAMYFYMACLFSVIHGRNAVMLFFIALLGPPIILTVTTVLLSWAILGIFLNWPFR
jgi:hypothetical protein